MTSIGTLATVGQVICKTRVNKVKELIEVLQKCDPEAELVSTIWNGWTNTGK